MSEHPRFAIHNAALYRVTRLPLAIMATMCLLITGTIIAWQQHRESERLQDDIAALITDQEHAFANELFLHQDRALRARLQATAEQVKLRDPGVRVCLSLRAANQEGFLPVPILECRGEGADDLWNHQAKPVRRVSIPVGNGISGDVEFTATFARTIKDIIPPSLLIAIIAALLCAMVVDVILVKRLQLRVVRPLLQRFEAHVNLAAIGFTTAGIAHDIKDPLHTIKKVAAHPINLERQGHIKEAVAEIEGLLEQLLDFSRSEPGSKSEIIPTEVAAETALLVDSFRMNLKLKGFDGVVAVELEIEPETKNLKAAIGARELRRLILNILRNATEALTSETPVAGARIRVSLVREERALRLNLANNGPPIPEQDFETIFWPFRSKRRSKGGSGLGLAIARKFAAHAGGALTVANRDGWVVFSLTIPILEEVLG